MTLDQHIAELHAELAGSILTTAERTAMRAELEQALHRKDRLEDEFELMLLELADADDCDLSIVDADFDRLGSLGEGRVA